MQTPSAPAAHYAVKLRNDEVIGLAIAIAAHVAIAVALAINALRAPAFIPPPERVTVSLAEDVGLTSTAPVVTQDAQASMSDTLGEAPEPKPQVEKPLPPKPALPKVTNKPVVSPNKSSVIPKPKPSPAVTPKKPGTSKVGADFLGKGDKPDANALVPASEIGSSVKASLFSQIARQIRPNWKPPSGVDSDQLVTVIRFRLNPDGTLAGRPTVVTQRGLTDANRPQAGRHAELAVRAVQLAAPFELEPKYYEAWKSVGPLDFDWKLSQ